mmetsp:Transcript_14245/g.56068  ORF Transcript_14245/g.56068 Transcript_14245/m.56068 type:complete len:346 (-) Transcript_14245:80-1117(-)
MLSSRWLATLCVTIAGALPNSTVSPCAFSDLAFLFLTPSPSNSCTSARVALASSLWSFLRDFRSFASPPKWLSTSLWQLLSTTCIVGAPYMLNAASCTFFLLSSDRFSQISAFTTPRCIRSSFVCTLGTCCTLASWSRLFFFVGCTRPACAAASAATSALAALESTFTSFLATCDAEPSPMSSIQPQPSLPSSSPPPSWFASPCSSLHIVWRHLRTAEYSALGSVLTPSCSARAVAVSDVPAATLASTCLSTVMSQLSRTREPKQWKLRSTMWPSTVLKNAVMSEGVVTRFITASTMLLPSLQLHTSTACSFSSSNAFVIRSSRSSASSSSSPSSSFRRVTTCWR